MAENSLCGWCLTNHHDKCIKSIKHYEKIWYCGCPDCKTEGIEIEQVKEEEADD